MAAVTILLPGKAEETMKNLRIAFLGINWDPGHLEYNFFAVCSLLFPLITDYQLTFYPTVSCYEAASALYLSSIGRIAS
jgi:hypothetical protein